MKTIQRITALLLALVLALSLCACGGGFADDVTTLVRGNLDELYLGSFDEEYMKLVSATQEECQQSYEDGMGVEADFFAYYFGIELTEDQRAEVIEMYKEIYAKSSYTVNDAEKEDENTYRVKVDIQPIDLFVLVDEVWEETVSEFNANYKDVNTMTDAEYEAYLDDAARMIIDLCKSKMPDMGNLETKTVYVQVTKDSNNYWSITDDDMGALDEAMISYP